MYAQWPRRRTYLNIASKTSSPREEEVGMTLQDGERSNGSCKKGAGDWSSPRSNPSTLCSREAHVIDQQKYHCDTLSGYAPKYQRKVFITSQKHYIQQSSWDDLPPSSPPSDASPIRSPSYWNRREISLPPSDDEGDDIFIQPSESSYDGDVSS
jgi:hypothetical protein